jgi:hypothetical protein
MSAIIKSGAWDYSGALLTGIVAAPIAVEVISTAVDVAQNPGIIKKKWNQAKEFIVDSFTRRPEELVKDYRWRVVKNIALTIGILCLFAAAVGLPFIILPSAFAIPVAISAVSVLGRSLSHAGEIKQKMVSLFTRGADETQEVFNKRFRANVIKAICLVVVLGALAIAAAYLIPIVIKIISTTPVWSIPDKLFNFQNATTVTIAYICLGVLHLAKAIYHFKKGEKALGYFHLTNALLGIIFPIMYLQDPVTRLHHSFTGLLLQLLPFRSMRILGGVITFDSFLNLTMSNRGYVTKDFFGRDDLHRYDFMNIVVEHVPVILLAYSATCSYQLLKDRFFASKNEGICNKIQKIDAAQRENEKEALADIAAAEFLERQKDLSRREWEKYYHQLKVEEEYFEAILKERLDKRCKELCRELELYNRSQIPAVKLDELEKLMELAEYLEADLSSEVQKKAEDFLHPYEQII